jgi:hypothetical protein
MSSAGLADVVPLERMGDTRTLRDVSACVTLAPSAEEDRHGIEERGGAAAHGRLCRMCPGEPATG